MNRSLQEIVELVIFGIIAVVFGTGLLWLLGQLFRFMGWLFVIVAKFLFGLLLWIVPIAIAAVLVYYLIRFLRGRADTPADHTGQTASTVGSGNESAKEVAATRTAPSEPIDIGEAAPETETTATSVAARETKPAAPVEAGEADDGAEADDEPAELRNEITDEDEEKPG